MIIVQSFLWTAFIDFGDGWCNGLPLYDAGAGAV